MADLLASCCLSEHDKESRNRSREIDKTIMKDRLTFRRTVRILLLGAGESGKSTFLKQMRIIHGQDFGEGAVLEFKTVVYNNIVKGMRVLIDARQKLGITWGTSTCEKDASFVFAFESTAKLDERLFTQYVEPIRRLWSDSGIRTAFDRRREFQLVGITTTLPTPARDVQFVNCDLLYYI